MRTEPALLANGERTFRDLEPADGVVGRIVGGFAGPAEQTPTGRARAPIAFAHAKPALLVPRSTV